MFNHTRYWLLSDLLADCFLSITAVPLNCRSETSLDFIVAGEQISISTSEHEIPHTQLIVLGFLWQIISITVIGLPDMDSHLA